MNFEAAKLRGGKVIAQSVFVRALTGRVGEKKQAGLEISSLPGAQEMVGRGESGYVGRIGCGRCRMLWFASGQYGNREEDDTETRKKTSAQRIS